MKKKDMRIKQAEYTYNTPGTLFNPLLFYFNFFFYNVTQENVLTKGEINFGDLKYTHLGKWQYLVTKNISKKRGGGVDCFPPRNA